jgi:hypothetical protein
MNQRSKHWEVFLALNLAHRALAAALLRPAADNLRRLEVVLTFAPDSRLPSTQRGQN